ncbi:N-acetylmuramoyl-L-alanine amidase [Proteiniclasticum ruminis]|uniref:N-acetylmuramoyl-L-alanine amidase n=1 Tax=Proteiniclasticum ruminis TaxID=398199 RepID=A0A1G8HCT6_9CLOT|nr:N-acetylmuramoyl-L-alanine amidase [Proteiniclasticum ruminis]SDI04409.1 N-acetylmuramoyl-L-alanine amidase [Proteiniclasticum ruminis]
MKLLLLIDAGHGLYTYGKRCLKTLDPNEIREWFLNNRIAEYLEDEMEAYEDVVVARLDDPTGKRDVPLKERADNANKLYAQYIALGYVVIIISIHHNAGINGGRSGGITTIVDSRRASARSLEIRDRIYDELIAVTGPKENRSTPKSRQPLYILNKTDMPGTLVERGFMDSPTDIIKILSDEFARQCAAAHRNFAVKDYSLKKKAVKLAPKPVDDSKDYGYFTAATLNVRSGRSTNHRVVTQLKRGAKVEKLYLANGWWSIAVPL